MSPLLSIVAPVYNEAPILRELAARCLEAARRVDPGAEVLLVDDASTDATPEIARALPRGVEVLRLPANRGQLGATKAGLARARGEVVVVLDGDLQDPPEIIPRLVHTLRDRPDVDVVFATKRSRRDPPWFRVGRSVYGLLTRLPGGRMVPAGAGSFCAMRRPWAGRAAAVGLSQANLAPVLIALGARATSVPYHKAARYDGRSRVGPAGLAREAAGSLVLTGAAGDLARAASAALIGVGLARRRGVPGMVLAAGVLYLAGGLADRQARRALQLPEARR